MHQRRHMFLIPSLHRLGELCLAPLPLGSGWNDFNREDGGEYEGAAKIADRGYHLAKQYHTEQRGKQGFRRQEYGGLRRRRVALTDGLQRECQTA